jgi:hypothetical protein
MAPRKPRDGLMRQENTKKVHALARWYMRQDRDGSAAKVLLANSTDAERKDVAKALGEMIAEDDRRSARSMQAAVDELQALRAVGDVTLH